MSDLLARLDDISRFNRMTDIEAAAAGSPFHSSNFKVKWQGYNENGNAIVEYNGEKYVAKSLARGYRAKDAAAYLRVAEGHRTVNY